jgi:hypothetical protein
LRQYKMSGTALITAATVNVGTIDMEAALDRGAAREPNHWSAAIPMLSSTNIASIAPVTSIPQGLRLGSARYSVPHRLIGATVTLLAGEQRLEVVDPASGEIIADHALAAPGTASVLDEHYPNARPDRPLRAPRPRTATETRFLALGEIAEAFLTGAAAAGVTKLGGEIEQVNTLAAAHGEQAVLDALRRAVAFRRWRAGDVASILAAGNGVATPRAAGEALILDLPVAPTRSLDAYRIGGTR